MMVREKGSAVASLQMSFTEYQGISMHVDVAKN